MVHAGLSTCRGSSVAVQELIDYVDHLKCRALSSSRSWEKLHSFSGAYTLSELCIEPEFMVEKGSAETTEVSRSYIKNFPTSLKLAFDGGCQLSNEEKGKVSMDMLASNFEMREVLPIYC